AEGRKDVDAIRFVRKRNWHHIRLIVQRTSQPADRYSLQELTAFLFGYGNDSHDRISPDTAASLDYGLLFATCHRRTHGGVGGISRGPYFCWMLIRYSVTFCSRTYPKS